MEWNKVRKYIRNPYKIVNYLGARGKLKFLPDKLYLKLKYYACLEKKLNLNNPTTFNEKLQWLKLYDRRPEYTQLVDKYDVRKYIGQTIGKEYLIPLLGVWDNFNDIDFSRLPDQFVLKCTHDSGGLVICKDKNKLDVASVRKKINRCLERNFYFQGREWPYKNVEPQIIAEKYMEEDKNDTHSFGLTDYKFYCFNGKPKFLYVSRGLGNHSTARISFLNLDYNWAPFRREDYKPLEFLPKKPLRYEEMILLAEKLSRGHSFIRVDLYEIKGNIYFSELTFSPCSGFMPFKPEKYDLILGEYLILPNC